MIFVNKFRQLHYMKTKFFCVLSAVLCILCANAQEYHYAELFDASGPVKEIKTDSKNSFVQKKIKIDKDGRGGPAIMSYDDKGYPTGFEINMLGKANFQKFFWNEECRLDSAAIQIAAVGRNSLITVKNSYSGKNLTAQHIKVKEDDGQIEYIMTFGDYSYDTMGNWISRSVRRLLTDKDGKESDANFVETRTFKYYDTKSPK